MRTKSTSVIAFTLILSSIFAVFLARSQLGKEFEKAGIQPNSNLQSFLFLGCSGDWKDKNSQPQVWRTGAKDKISFLIKHPATCGYTTGSAPNANITNSSIVFSYLMSNDSGVAAACDCEYWAIFELKSAPEEITKISVNGVTAQLMGGLSQKN